MQHIAKIVGFLKLSLYGINSLAIAQPASFCSLICYAKSRFAGNVLYFPIQIPPNSLPSSHTAGPLTNESVTPLVLWRTYTGAIEHSSALLACKDYYHITFKNPWEEGPARKIFLEKIVLIPCSSSRNLPLDHCNAQLLLTFSEVSCFSVLFINFCCEVSFGMSHFSEENCPCSSLNMLNMLQQGAWLCRKDYFCASFRCIIFLWLHCTTSLLL